MSSRLLTAAQVAERLGVTERYVWRLGRQGDLPRIPVGAKYVRFDEADVDAYIEHQRNGSRPAAAPIRLEAVRHRPIDTSPTGGHRRRRRFAA